VSSGVKGVAVWALFWQAFEDPDPVLGQLCLISGEDVVGEFWSASGMDLVNFLQVASWANLGPYFQMIQTHSQKSTRLVPKSICYLGCIATVG